MNAPSSRPQARTYHNANWRFFSGLAVICLLLASASTGWAVGSFFHTTDSAGTKDLHTFTAKSDVWIVGKATSGHGLADGPYFVRVTGPAGNGPGDVTLGDSGVATVTVSGGALPLSQLVSLVWKASDSNIQGFDDTPNAGGEYKVLISQNPAFPSNATSVDAFKVSGDSGPPPTPATICVYKFYDANANGIFDTGDSYIADWNFTTFNGLNATIAGSTCFDVEPGNYTVMESTPNELSWKQTTFASTSGTDTFTVASGDTHTTPFGNVCIGTGGGLTLGYWSNKNGANTILLSGGADITFLNSLNLRDAKGNHATFSSKWLLNATATNMAYMLSAQLAAMELNTRHTSVTNVSGSSILYRPELNGYGITYNGGFITINTLMAAANSELADPNGLTVAAGAERTKQEALKNALDDANNNKPFYVQPTPCMFTFLAP